MSVTIGTLMAYIGADTSGLKRGEREAKSSLNAMSRDVKKSVKEMSKGFGDLNQIVAGFISAQAIIGAVTSSFRALTAEVSSGIKYVEEYNMTVIDIAASLTNASKAAREGGDVGAVYKQAKEYAEQLVPIIERLDARTVASGRDLTEMYSAFIRGGAEIDLMNIKQQDAFVGIANAMKALLKDQFNERQINQEISSLMMGRITMSEKLGKTLKLMDPDIEKHVQQWKTQGNLLENIIKLMPGYTAATEDVGQQWGAIKSSLETIHAQILRKGMLGVYKDLVDSGNALKSILIDQNGQLTEMGLILSQTIADSWNAVRDSAQDFVEYLNSPEAQKAINEFMASIPEKVKSVRDSISDLIAIYKSLPEGTTTGIIGLILLGPKGAAIAYLTDAVDLVEAIANSIRGFEAAKSGKITWMQYATSDAEKLKKLLGDLNGPTAVRVEIEKGAATFQEALAAAQFVGPMPPAPTLKAPKGAGDRGGLTTEELEKEAKKREKIEKDITKWNLEQLDLRTEGLDAFYTWSQKEQDEDFEAQLKKKQETDALISKSQMDSLAQMTEGLDAFYTWSEEGQEEYRKQQEILATAIAETWVKAFSTIEGQFENTFMMAMDGDFDSILDSWANMLQQMVAKWAASQAMMALFGEDSGKGGQGGSGLLGALGTFVGGLFGGQTTGMASGGMITEPVLGIGTSTGRRYKFGESEAERVTPVSQLGTDGKDSGNSGAVSPTINIMAVDPLSFSEFTKRNPQAIIGPITDALQKGDRNLRSAIRGA